MAWIRQTDEGKAQGDLARAYEKIRGQRGHVSDIFRAESLRPAAVEAHLALRGAIMDADTGLSALEREAVAVAVSAENKCVYGIARHSESLVSADEHADTILAIREGRHSELPERLAAILDHARRLTRAPAAVAESDIQLLRDAGLSDEEVLDLSLVVAYANFANRIILGLGVE
ncbi:MAG: peroxidase-related enzyme [Gammaproteobacteria bacterium]